MAPERWREIERVYHLARDLSPSRRAAFLEQTCGGDKELRREVESLLNHAAGAGEFLEAAVLAAHSRDLSGVPTVESPTVTAKPSDVSEYFQSTPRFAVQQRLGAGSFGVVYRVFDRERNSQVALKKLLQFDPARLLRFKREFRSLVDLVHPNLVQFYELFGQDRQWFFTMELVEGVDFVSYVRAGNVAERWERLRDALFQLAAGVQALHSSARLHRDLKPSNVLVTGNGRVVILDFGLVKEFGPRSLEDTFPLAGSPAYMAPEQVAGRTIDKGADWYAVGVMLYKALTGQLPFTGHWTECLERKRREPAPQSRDLAPDAPEDLNDACESLLQRSPELRAPGAAILLAQRPPNTSGLGREQQEEFVGRHVELSLLRDRFGALSAGSCQVVLLQGKSGIGKTSLLSHFLSDLKRNHADAVILRGRCRESESVPYKALDPIADELVRHLRSLGEPAAMAVLPRHPELLRRLFPVFGQLEMLSTFRDRSVSDLDEQQVRRRAFEALRELLGRMTDRTPVVISIDDLQWGDLDSVAFLAELVLPVSPPALLLILSFRSEEAGSSPALLALRGLRQRLTDSSSWWEIEIKGLSEDESRDLLDLLRMKGSAITEEQSRGIVRESGGSPLLLSELLRFAARGTEGGKAGEGVLISDMIRQRAGSLSSTARQLLEALCVAGEPLSKAMLCRVVRTDEDPAREIGRLIREHLVRVTGGAQETKVEPFHDQVREASLSWLSPDELRNWHSHLAELLQTEPGADPQRLLRHYRGAGNSPAAFEAALAAAGNAETALAFEQAARFYAEALETGEAGEAAQANLYRKRAEALAKAGRGYESGQCYLQAAAWPAHNDAPEMRRLAGEQLMRSGYLDDGTRIFFDLLRGAGIYMPARPLESLLCMLCVRAFIKCRGLRWRERSEADIPADTLRKLDLLWNGALVLTEAHPIFATYLQARHMLRALRAGEPFRLALTFSLGAVYESLGGTREYEHGLKLLNLARQLAQRLEDPYLSALAYLGWATVDFMCGRVEDGLVHCRSASAGLEQVHHRARAWEVDVSNTMLIWFLGWGGRVRELSEKLPWILEDARSRGDVHADVSARCCTTSHLIELAADNPERAIAETARAMDKRGKTGYDLQNFGATFCSMECHLYAGRAGEARQVLLADWAAIRHSLIFRKSQSLRVVLYYARGRTALAAWLERPGARGARELRVEIEQFSRRLAKLHSPWGDALSKVLRAGVMAGLGSRRDALLLLQSAEEILRKQDLRLLAAAVLRRRGELEGETGADRVAAADAFMSSENILRPDRMTAMILPGNWLSPLPI